MMAPYASRKSASRRGGGLVEMTGGGGVKDANVLPPRFVQSFFLVDSVSVQLLLQLLLLLMLVVLPPLVLVLPVLMLLALLLLLLLIPMLLMMMTMVTVMITTMTTTSRSRKLSQFPLQRAKRRGAANSVRQLGADERNTL